MRLPLDERYMATARTMRGYLNTPDGAIYGFAPNVTEPSLLSGPPRTPKTSISGLWLAPPYGGPWRFQRRYGCGRGGVRVLGVQGGQANETATLRHR